MQITKLPLLLLSILATCTHAAPFFYKASKGESSFHILGTHHHLSYKRLAPEVRDFIENDATQVLTETAPKEVFQNLRSHYPYFMDKEKAKQEWAQAFQSLTSPEEYTLFRRQISNYLRMGGIKNKEPLHFSYFVVFDVLRNMNRLWGKLMLDWKIAHKFPANKVFSLEGQEQATAKEIFDAEVDSFTTQLQNRTPQEKARMLINILRDLEKKRADPGLNRQLEAMKQEYLTGTSRLLEDQSVSTDSPYANNINRHRIWIPRIMGKLAASEKTLVIAGSGHLIGPSNLLTLLEAQGFLIEKVISKPHP